VSALRRATRPARHALAYGALRILAGALRLLPLAGARALGALVGRVAGWGARADSRRTRAALSMLDAPPTVGACWADLGRRAAELACADRALALVDFTPQAEALLRAPPAGPILVATAHLGHWELLAGALAARLGEVHAVAARAQTGPLHRWLARTRARLGVRVYGPGGSRAVLRHLRGGGAAALFVDQNTGERGRHIDFLGRPAPTPATFERLLRLSGATPLFAWCALGPDGRYAAHLEPVPSADALDALTARLDALVRAHPTQWVWLHARWRARPARSGRRTPPCAAHATPHGPEAPKSRT
jgi:lauroyl/myristoyl acyltransferase